MITHRTGNDTREQGQGTEPGILESDAVTVRSLAPEDLDWVVRIDKGHSGRARTEYFRVKLRESQTDTGVRVSLAAVVDKEPAGFLMGRVYFGEFGVAEPVAVLDTIGVAPAFAGKHVGQALMRQFTMNLRALGVETVRTEVDWLQEGLLSFFGKNGFKPSGRLCLEAHI